MTTFRDITKNMQKAIDAALHRSKMKENAELMAKLIKERTRKGGGVKKVGGNVSKLRALAPSTIASRRRKKLHSATSPGKSNLTETGQMLDALYGVGIKKGEGSVRIRPNRKGGGITNDEVAFFVSGARPFVDLSKGESTVIAKKVEKDTSKALKKYL